MTPLTKSFDEIVARYHGPEGDAFAIDELLPRRITVSCRPADGHSRSGAATGAISSRSPRFRTPPSPVATSRSTSWCARRRAPAAVCRPSERNAISLARQEPFRLPFRDGTFDLVVLWQVLEHVDRRGTEAQGRARGGARAEIQAAICWSRLRTSGSGRTITNNNLPPSTGCSRSTRASG
jgi:hypothetical protein